MNKLFVVALILFSSDAFSAWVGYKSDETGSVFFYDDERIRKHGDIVYIWERTRYERDLVGVWSSQALVRINCTEYSYIQLHLTLYSDKNWMKFKSHTDEGMKVYPQLDSAALQLVDIVCKK